MRCHPLIWGNRKRVWNYKLIEGLLYLERYLTSSEETTISDHVCITELSHCNTYLLSLLTLMLFLGQDDDKLQNIDVEF